MADTYWCEVKLAAVPETEAELIADFFQEEGAGGVVYDDPAILDQVTLTDDEYLGEEFPGKLPGTFGMRAYFPVDDRLGERLQRLAGKLEPLLGTHPEFELRQIREEDWAEAWKSYFKPEHIGQIVIKPSWENYSVQQGELVVELDPGMAFGTGTHPTTRLCLLLLQELVKFPLQVLDVGTGSGILAVSAAKLGAAAVVASDIDPLAVRIAAENAERNGVAGRIACREGNLLELGLTKQFDLVVANIIANAILAIIPDVPGVLAPGGRFLASGIIEERYPEVQAALGERGFVIEKSLHEDGWVAVIAVMRELEA
ncbi:[LSU ribosomal protein L11P]-lysine N-methyltransferase [Hydrogenispora ethanolica]|uniref:Ribosomal protein L11 methyltransferase n=1 Tax=Hydrogenispora ethanolica TaxID=1082276 RepID=A0A4R1REE7_HYDET|nr:50S ribosomal protein L11 methyltransferase [Hydrogenispora ethanolica]TCL64285.1 [LSU ribosomal protein L11P]-lysine N-methyltransferase [Hydrogenispora ethanolica]